MCGSFGVIVLFCVYLCVGDFSGFCLLLVLLLCLVLTRLFGLINRFAFDFVVVW